MVDFIQEDIICYHSCFEKLIINRRQENKDAIAELAERYKIKKIVVSAYYSQANEMIERGHKLIVNTFLKMSAKESTNWDQNLPTVLWAD